jgi:hypothetical protein
VNSIFCDFVTFSMCGVILIIQKAISGFEKLPWMGKNRNESDH